MDAIRRSRAGDPGAFAEVFDQYKNLVYRTAYLMLGDVHDAEDALQDVFWQVYRALGSYDSAKGAFTTWLHTITVNHCLNRQRKDRVGMIVNDPHWDSLPGHGSPDLVVESDDSLHRMLSSLGEKQRAVVVLRFVWDLSYDEIARILDIPLGTVQSRLHGALKVLRERLAGGETFTGWQSAGEGSNGY